MTLENFDMDAADTLGQFLILSVFVMNSILGHALP